MRLLLRGLLLAVFVWMAGCAQRPVDSTDAATAGVSRPAPTMGEDALRELAGLPASSADDTALAWAAEYLGLGKTEATAMLLNHLDGQVLNAPRQARRTLLRAQWHLVLQQPEQAEAVLSDANLLAILPQLDNNLRSRIG
ncbi:MAG: hypothetical protein V2I38_04635, partial [Alcanivoracaceae bacterium]|nr:hypothetical protein [Alcanivoracaceae bacterium]